MSLFISNTVNRIIGSTFKHDVKDGHTRDHKCCQTGRDEEGKLNGYFIRESGQPFSNCVITCRPGDDISNNDKFQKFQRYLSKVVEEERFRGLPSHTISSGDCNISKTGAGFIVMGD